MNKMIVGFIGFVVLIGGLNSAMLTDDPHGWVVSLIGAALLLCSIPDVPEKHKKLPYSKYGEDATDADKLFASSQRRRKTDKGEE